MSFKRIVIAWSFLVLFVYGGLIGSLFFFFDWDQFAVIISAPKTLFSIRLSLMVATIVTVVSVTIAIPSAYALSRYQFPGRKIIDTILELPMVVSPAALGAMLLIFFNTPAGIALQKQGLQFVFSPAGLFLAQFITTLGVATRLIKSSLDEIPKRYEHVARTLGASAWQTFIHVTLPLAKWGIIAAGILSWAKALGEFGASITIAGSMALRTETIPIAIYMRLSNADINGAVVLILVLIGIGLGLLYGVRFLGQRF